MSLLKDISATLQTNCYRRKENMEQQVISRASAPEPILQAINTCEPPPALNEMNRFRDDGKVSLKFFTDPDYFFRMWVEDMQEQTEKSQQKKKKKKASHCVSLI